MKAVAVSGTPGTGKSTFCKAICSRFNLKYVDVNQVISEHSLSSGYDWERHCRIVDVDKLNQALIRILDSARKTPVIDSHLSHFLPPPYIKGCFICKCSLKELKRRLEAKGYSRSKVRENLDSEIFEVCLNEAEEAGHAPIVIDTTSGIPKGAFQKVKKVLNPGPD